MQNDGGSFVRDLLTFQNAAGKKVYEHALATHSRDLSLGVRMGQVFALAKEYIAMPLQEVEKLLESDIHEVRVGAVSIMDFQARSKKTREEHRRELFDLYIRRHDRINTWDLVDRSAIYVVGSYLADKPSLRSVLYKLARSKNTAERRTAVVSTAYFMMKQKEVTDTLKIAELLLLDEEPLMHKATGWMLRVAGDVNRHGLEQFLDKYGATMPRAMLRNAVEKFDKTQKEHYMGLKKATL